MKKNRVKKADVPGRTQRSENNTLVMYMKELGKIPILAKNEEKRISKLAAEGNKAAREKLLSSNLRFVITIAKKYQGKGLDLEDLISEGNIGMINALKHFDPDKGYRFITYAVWWIRQAIIKALHEKGRMIRLPSNKCNAITRLEKTRQELQNKPGWKNAAEIKEAAGQLDISPEEAASLMQISQEIISLDDPELRCNDSLAVTMKDHIEDKYSVTPVDNAVNSIVRDDLNRALDSLEKRTADHIG